MHKALLAVAALCGWVLATPSLKAGLYNTAEPLLGPSADFNQFRAALADLQGIPNDQRTTPLRQHYLNQVAELEAKDRLLGLTPEDRVNLSAYLMRLGRYPRAIEVLTPAREAGNFMVLSNLATAYQLSDQPERAMSTLQQALKAWPQIWPGLSTAQLDWYRRAEALQLELLRLRYRETLAQRPGQRQTALKMDPLFPKVHFVGESGQYEAGELVAAERAELPPDAVAVVEQLLLWLPLDNALYWLLGELLNARGDIADAATVLDQLANRSLQSPELRQHRHILLEAKTSASKVQPLVKSGELLWVGRGDPLTPGVGSSLSVAVWRATLAELNRRDEADAFAPRPTSTEPHPAAAPVPANWLPDPHKVAIVGSVAGVLVLLLAYFQIRELRRRRPRTATAPRGGA